MEQQSSSSKSPLTRTTINRSSNVVEDGSTDLKGRPIHRDLTGGWKTAIFIIGVEIAERVAYHGINSNLVTYLSSVMHESTATAAKNVNIWSGTTTMLPLLGAFVADSYLGRYWTILLSSVVYLLGLCSLTMATSITIFRPPPCDSTSYFCPKPSRLQVGLFFFSLYLVALGQGGHKPCLEAFGADQFSERDVDERKYKASFFNWWYFGICSGVVLSSFVISYVLENVGWGLGFGIPTAIMAIALCIFIWGTKFYRHKLAGASPLTQIIRVFIAVIHKWNVSVPLKEEKLCAVQEDGLKVQVRRQLLPTKQLRFLDKAAMRTESDYEQKSGINWRLCTVTEVEEVKFVLRLFPIWGACLMYGVIFAQSPTFFIKQGSSMYRKIGSSFEIPAASLQGFIALSIVVLIPVYDRIFVPFAKQITGIERGITLLQRIGIGIFCSFLSMVVAALIEMKRLQASEDHVVGGLSNETIQLSIFWLLPQCILLGISDVFAQVGLQEFFYDQMPDMMKSLGIALYLSILGVGSFLSSIVISIVEGISNRSRGQSWFADNINKAHLDYYYWLLAALSAFFLCIYISLAGCFIYKEAECNNCSAEETV